MHPTNPKYFQELNRKLEEIERYRKIKLAKPQKEDSRENKPTDKKNS